MGPAHRIIVFCSIVHKCALSLLFLFRCIGVVVLVFFVILCVARIELILAVVFQPPLARHPATFHAMRRSWQVPERVMKAFPPHKSVDIFRGLTMVGRWSKFPHEVVSAQRCWAFWASVQAESAQGQGALWLPLARAQGMI